MSLSRLPNKRLRARRALETAGKPLLFAGLWFSRLYRPTFHLTSPVLQEVSDRLGVYPLIDHYHEPLIAPRRHLSDKPAVRTLPGIDLRARQQLELLASFASQEELLAIAPSYVDVSRPYYDNLAFPPPDAQVLHSMIRHLKPARVIEVGSGDSTRFIVNAMQLNAAEDPSRAGLVTCIEPYEARFLEQLNIDVWRTRVEDASVEVFAALRERDILVIDSSHVARPGGDVLHLLQQVLPALRPGVVVHFHDVFTPRDYPRSWINRRILWDEQYLVEALLTHSSWLRVLLAVNWLYHDHSQEFRSACPAAQGDPREPASLWLEVTKR